MVDRVSIWRWFLSDKRFVRWHHATETRRSSVDPWYSGCSRVRPGRQSIPSMGVPSGWRLKSVMIVCNRLEDCRPILSKIRLLSVSRALLDDVWSSVCVWQWYAVPLYDVVVSWRWQAWWECDVSTDSTSIRWWHWSDPSWHVAATPDGYDDCPLATPSREKVSVSVFVSWQHPTHNDDTTVPFTAFYCLQHHHERFLGHGHASDETQQGGSLVQKLSVHQAHSLVQQLQQRFPSPPHVSNETPQRHVLFHRYPSLTLDDVTRLEDILLGPLCNLLSSLRCLLVLGFSRRRFDDTFLHHLAMLFALREGFDGLRCRRYICRGGEYCSSRHVASSECHLLRDTSYEKKNEYLYRFLYCHCMRYRHCTVIFMRRCVKNTSEYISYIRIHQAGRQAGSQLAVSHAHKRQRFFFKFLFKDKTLHCFITRRVVSEPSYV